ncbi:ZC3H3 protein, partial [Lophotis ruficrista]|nr:ZC3H3 protein [Lophotis ruficrista]
GSSPAGENAVTLKSEPRQPPAREPARHLVRRKAEPPAAGRPGCERVGDAFGEPKLLGNGETRSRPAQAAALVAGMSPVKSRFSVVSKAAGPQRATSTPVSGKAPKFRRTNYTWVANPGKCSRVVKRWVSPKASESAKKVAGGADRAAKPSPKADLGAKLKKSGLQSKVGVSPSKYKWKASGLQTSPSTSKSAFRGAAWSLVTQRLFSALGEETECVSITSLPSPNHLLLCLRSSPTDKKTSSSPAAPLKSHFHLRKKNSLRGKPSTTPKRSSPKGLVQITRHRLCRLPATRMQVSTKEGRN